MFSAAARELEVRDVLPYARHLDEEIIALDTGALMIAFALEGASFETADLEDINNRHGKLNGAWRNIADEHFAIWHHLVRHPEPAYPEARFRSAFAERLDGAYRTKITAQQLFRNDLYLTLVLHPGSRAEDRAQSVWARLTGRTSEAEVAGRAQRLRDAAQDLVQHLARYAPRQLRIRRFDGQWISEPLGMLRLVLTGRTTRAHLPLGHLGEAICAERIIFGREALEIRETATRRFGAILGVKDYPALTRPGLWDGLLELPHTLIVAQSFAFLSKPSARAVMERKQNQMVSARDRAASQVGALSEALDDLVSNRFVMGEHQASVLVLADTSADLAEALARTRAVLAESGLVAVREDLGLEGAFWSQFPGQFRKRPRPAAITSRNFAALAPFHTHPTGRAAGNHWGPAVALLRTSAGSPFFFNFHVADLGHTFICGPSGSGKTVLQNFLLAQLEKSGAQQIFIDKDRGAEIFIRACGGAYFTLRNGQPTGFAPLRALTAGPADRAFLSNLVRKLVTLPGERLGAEALAAIDQGVAAVLTLPASERSLLALRALLGQRDSGGVGARLERWTRQGPLGWVLDNKDDLVSLAPPLVGFDLTEILDHPEVRDPAMIYLFHRIQGLVDGRRLVLDIDEFWKALADPGFQALAQDGLKTWRKQNAFMVFGTQSPADVLRSPIAHTIVEMCATKIFLPNPAAAERDYREGFGLTEAEFRLVRDTLNPGQRRFLVKQGHDSVVAELDLGGLTAELAILSGRAETVERLDQLRARHGDAPEAWLAHFLADRSGS
jgi:type IV secretion system protein VirB4